MSHVVFFIVGRKIALPHSSRIVQKPWRCGYSGMHVRGDIIALGMLAAASMSRSGCILPLAVKRGYAQLCSTSKVNEADGIHHECPQKPIPWLG